MFRRSVFGLVLLVLSMVPVTTAPAARAVEPAAGRILAPSSRQAAWLNLAAPRPERLTTLQAPAYVADVAVSPGGQAAVAIEAPFQDSGPIAGDVLRLDLASGATQPLVMRADSDESIGAPAWSAADTQLFVQREDRRTPPISYPGMTSVRYPSRIESVAPGDGTRSIVRDDARLPAPSPDGTLLAYVRSNASGSALLLATLGTDAANDRELLPAGAVPDLASPRFSPIGDQIAFMVNVPFGAQHWPGHWFNTAVASAHGFPWDVWLVNVDGSNARRLAELGGDDASVSWSPDGSQVFVYGGSGSYVVDVKTRDVAEYPYLAGYGATAWVP